MLRTGPISSAVLLAGALTLAAPDTTPASAAPGDRIEITFGAPTRQGNAICLPLVSMNEAGKVPSRLTSLTFTGPAGEPALVEFVLDFLGAPPGCAGGSRGSLKDDYLYVDGDSLPWVIQMSERRPTEPKFMGGVMAYRPTDTTTDDAKLEAKRVTGVLVGFNSPVAPDSALTWDAWGVTVPCQKVPASSVAEQNMMNRSLPVAGANGGLEIKWKHILEGDGSDGTNGGHHYPSAKNASPQAIWVDESLLNQHPDRPTFFSDRSDLLSLGALDISDMSLIKKLRPVDGAFPKKDQSFFPANMKSAGTIRNVVLYGLLACDGTERRTATTTKPNHLWLVDSKALNLQVAQFYLLVSPRGDKLPTSFPTLFP